MHHRSALFVLLVAGCAAGSPDAGSPRGGSPTGVDSVVAPEPGPGYALDLGASSIGGIPFVAVDLFESGEGRCSVPNGAGFAGTDPETGDRVAASVLYVGDSPAGTYALDGTSNLEGIDGDGNPTIYGPSASLELGGTHWFDTSGALSVEVSPDFDEATVIVDADLETLDGASMEARGELVAPFGVLCFVLVEEDGCGWLPEPAPYASDFCIEATAPFPEHVRY